MTEADVRFYFDPVCPFAWMTSKWVRMVAAQRDYAVDWRFISLRLINSAVDSSTALTDSSAARSSTVESSSMANGFVR